MALIGSGKNIKTYTSLLEKYHEAYYLIDDRRRKAFYHLYYSVAVLFIIFFQRPQSDKSIPVFGVDINRDTVKILIPFLILFGILYDPV